MKAVIGALHAVFLLLCLGYLAYALAMEGEAITSLFLQTKPALLVPAFLLWPAGVFVTAWFASQVIAGTGNPVGYRKILAIYLNRIPAKYLPGGVWQTFARAWDLNSLGLEKTRIGILVFYENSWTVILAALFSSIVLLGRGSAGIYAGLAMLLLAGIAVLLPVAFVLRRKPFILAPATYLAMTVSGMLFWIVAGGSFLLYLHALAAVPDAGIIELFTDYLFAYVMGFLSIFTPQGIGVFEFVMTQLTDFSILQSQALILVAGFRIIVLLGDMIAWLGFLLLNRARQTNKNKTG